MAVKPCLGTPNRPRCPNYAPKGKSRCPSCLREIKQWHTGARGTSGLWRKMRGRALLRDGWTCQKCGSRDDLEVHHVDLNANNNVIGNLLTLCADCHKEERNLPKTPGWSHSGHLRPIDQKPTKG